MRSLPRLNIFILQQKLVLCLNVIRRFGVRLKNCKPAFLKTGFETRPVYFAGMLLLASLTVMLLIAGALDNKSGPVADIARVVPSANHQARHDDQGGTAVQAERPRPNDTQIQEAKPTAAAVSPAAASGSAKVVPDWIKQGERLWPFGWQQHPIYKDWRFHTGIDIKCSQGQAVSAVAPGRAKVYHDKNYGLTVAVSGDTYTFFYGSLSSAKVAEDSAVKAGEIIGTAGECSLEPYPHLHLAVKKGDKYIDPEGLIR